MNKFRNINGSSGVLVSIGKGQVKEMCLQMFLEGSTWNGWMDRQWEVSQKRRGTRGKCSCTFVGLDQKDLQTNTFPWSQWMKWKWWGKHGVKTTRQFFMNGFVGQQTDLEQYSKPYWQPKEGTTQWYTATKWRWLCRTAGQSILKRQVIIPYDQWLPYI